MKLFAVSIQAKRVGTGSIPLISKAATVSHVCAAVTADSEAEARGMALQAAEKEFPRADGWLDHSVSVMGVFSDMIVAAARGIEE